MQETDYYIPAVALISGFLLRTPGLIRGWRNSMVRSVNFLLLLAGAGFLFGAPPTITHVNRITGISNFSAPLVYSLVCAFNYCCLVLIENWLHGEGEKTHRRIQMWRAGCIIAITLIIGFFTWGDAPEERRVDFDTYYATTPGIVGTIVTYLLAHLVAATAIAIMCWRGTSEVRSWTRAGLWVLVVGFVLTFAYGVAKMTAVVARWFGTDWDWLSTSAAPPIVSVGGVLVTIGFLIPVLGPKAAEQGTAAVDFFRLRVLWQLVRPAAGGGSGVLAAPLWSSPTERLTYRTSATQDRILRLQPYFDDDVRRAAHDASLAEGKPAKQAAARGIAVMLATAADQATAGGHVSHSATSARAAYLAAEATYDDLLLEVASQLPSFAPRSTGAGVNRTGFLS
ncbi:MAB_1171c family putative transporter [Streptomyces erythrochromogenes]|uniref:MAB_1171c family putative transporter n=1 Tax=Streptomyces erythrochromogenes TaxID=285574 RepID=UPI003694CC39